MLDFKKALLTNRIPNYRSRSLIEKYEDYTVNGPIKIKNKIKIYSPNM